MAENKQQPHGAARGLLDNWHFRKDIHAGHIFTTLTMGAAIIVAWTNMAAEVDNHEQRIALLEQALQEDDTSERLARIETGMNNISVTQERILDRLDRRADNGRDRYE